MMTSTLERFETPEAFLSGIDPRAAADILAAACDIVVALDRKGQVVDLASGAADRPIEGTEGWRGQAFEDLVSAETRPKARQLIEDAASGLRPRWRQVNHAGVGDDDVPVQYCAVPAPSGGGTLLLGRDMRSIARLQSRLVGTQQNLERDYARLRQLETRYQILLRSASDGVLVVEAATGRILEANPAAAEILSRRQGELVSQSFPLGLDAESTEEVERTLSALRSVGRADRLVVRTADGQELDFDGTLLRGEHAHVLLLTLQRHNSEAAAPSDLMDRRIAELVARTAEGVVLTDRQGRILWANDAFLDLVQAAVDEQVRGQTLDRFFGRPGVDLSVMLANAREHGQLRLFATSISGEFGAETEVDVSVVALRDGTTEGFGFVMRNAAFARQRESGGGTALPRSVEQLTALIGRMPLKEIVRETTDVIERLCIQTALHMTRDNRASAADLLGLSRQSLYVKLRRHGLGDLDGSNDPN